MKPMDIALYGVGFTALAGVVMWLLRKFSVGGSVADVTSKLLNNSLNQKKEEINNITAQQEVVVKQFKAAEEASVEAKTRIDQVAMKASQEINAILREDSIKKIDDNIKNDWKDL